MRDDCCRVAGHQGEVGRRTRGEIVQLRENTCRRILACAVIRKIYFDKTSVVAFEREVNVIFCQNLVLVATGEVDSISRQDHGASGRCCGVAAGSAVGVGGVGGVAAASGGGCIAGGDLKCQETRQNIGRVGRDDAGVAHDGASRSRVWPSKVRLNPLS